MNSRCMSRQTLLFLLKTCWQQQDHLALLLPGPFHHLFAQAQRAHIGPDFLDIGQAVALEPLLAYFSPAQRKLAVSKPDRVLVLVIDNHRIDPLVFFFISWHGCSSFLHVTKWTRSCVSDRLQALPISPEQGAVDS